MFTSREKRREELRERFDFDCRCRSCERGDANDDAKRQRIRVLDETVYENVKVGDYNDARIHIEERRRLLEETKLDSPAEMYRLANDEQQCEEHRGSNPERALKAAREVEHFGSLCMLREQQAFIELGENIKKLVRSFVVFFCVLLLCDQSENTNACKCRGTCVGGGCVGVASFKNGKLNKVIDKQERTAKYFVDDYYNSQQFLSLCMLLSGEASSKRERG